MEQSELDGFHEFGKMKFFFDFHQTDVTNVSLFFVPYVSWIYYYVVNGISFHLFPGESDGSCYDGEVLGWAENVNVIWSAEGVEMLRVHYVEAMGGC
jgi:hypothetical protein